MEQDYSRRHGSEGVAAAMSLSHASLVQQTRVGELLSSGSSFSRTGAQSPWGCPQWVCLYDVTLSDLGRGIRGQAETIRFSLPVIQHLGQRLRSLGMVILLLVRFY